MGKGRGITYGLKFGDEIVSTIIIRKINANLTLETLKKLKFC